MPLQSKQTVPSTRRVLDVLRSQNGRIIMERPALAKVKFERMATSPFAFLRGSNGLFGLDVARLELAPVRVLLQGDAHLLNTGGYKTIEHEVAFFLNDFDDAIVGPFDWDVRRMATSIILAALEAGIGARDADPALSSFLQAYRKRIEKLTQNGGKALKTSPELTSKPAILVVEKAKERTNAHLLGHWTVLDTKRGRIFKEIPGHLEPATEADRRTITDGVTEYIQSIPPDLRHGPGFYQILDVAARLSGTGSIGNRNYYVLIRGKGATPEDALILQLKEEPGASYGPMLRVKAGAEEGRRVAEAQRTLQPAADRHLGYARVGPVSYYVRRISTARIGMDLQLLEGAQDFRDFAADAGRILAHAHARGGSATAIAGYLSERGGLLEEIADFASRYVAQVKEDFNAFCEALKTDPLIQPNSPHAGKGSGAGYTQESSSTERGGMPHNKD